MKTILLGNAGAGKSTLTRKLLESAATSVLSLDEIAFENNTASRRPLADSVAAVRSFTTANDSWIIEGCYADIVEAALPDCEQLIFLNPGVDTCVAHCRRRPWEPDKFASAIEQDANLENLLEWVRGYESRRDEYGLLQHREIFDGFSGDKREFNHPNDYGAL